jgi:hypothetical protein
MANRLNLKGLKMKKRKSIKKKARKQWLGWHFANATETLNYGDGRKIKVGITHKVNCEPIL